MKKFVDPELEIQTFEVEDIITDSGEPTLGPNQTPIG